MSLKERHDDSQRILVIGDDAASALIARELDADVQFVGLEEQVVRRVEGDVSRTLYLEDKTELELADAPDAAIVATSVDSLNLLYAQRLSVTWGLSDIVARVNDPQYHETFTSLGFDTVCAATTVSESLTESYTRLMA